MKASPSVKRVAFMALLDIFIITACAYIAMLTRYAPVVPDYAIRETTQGLTRLLPSYILINFIFGMYRVKWRDMTLGLLFRQALGCVCGLGISFLWEELLDLSQSRRYYLLIAFAFILGGICGSRVIMKLIRDLQARKHGELNEKRCVLTISAGNEPQSLIFQVQGKTVPGGENDIERIVSENGVTEIVICVSSSDREFTQRLSSACLSTGCFVKRI